LHSLKEAITLAAEESLEGALSLRSVLSSVVSGNICGITGNSWKTQAGIREVWDGIKQKDRATREQRPSSPIPV